ncbi:MAG TPA: hypothetical protein VF322_07175 [Gammaproteobacteria bacterium]
MLSLFTKQKTWSPDLLTLPSYCVPTEELSSLRDKREAQLQWMRSKGMTYLGDPSRRVEKRPPRPATPTVRLVSVRSHAADAAPAESLEVARDA